MTKKILNISKTLKKHNDLLMTCYKLGIANNFLNIHSKPMTMVLF